MRRKLWKHQQLALAKYKDREYFGLLFPCGTGKTLTAIAIAEEKQMPTLIIAPNALCQQWAESLADKEQTDEDWEVVVCTSKTKKTKKFQRDFEELLKGF